MPLMSRKADYALLILWYLNQQKSGGCARAIAGQFRLSRPFVANILKELCQKGFVASHRGVKGGYQLQRPVEEISLAELIETLDVSFRLCECNQVVPGEGCSLLPICPIQNAIDGVHRRLYEVLRGVTLGELFQAGCPGRPRIGDLQSLRLRQPAGALN